tara:strand:+ start:531 stop:713 length:183 start_codon:yes stop_codon:yes gene_type:complete
MSKDKKNNVPETQPVDIDAQLKLIESQIAELSGQHKLLTSMKEQGVQMTAPVSETANAPN